MHFEILFWEHSKKILSIPQLHTKDLEERWTSEKCTTGVLICSRAGPRSFPPCRTSPPASSPRTSSTSRSSSPPSPSTTTMTMRERRRRCYFFIHYESLTISVCPHQRFSTQTLPTLITIISLVLGSSLCQHFYPDGRHWPTLAVRWRLLLIKSVKSVSIVQSSQVVIVVNININTIINININITFSGLTQDKGEAIAVPHITVATVQRSSKLQNKKHHLLDNHFFRALEATATAHRGQWAAAREAAAKGGHHCHHHHHSCHRRSVRGSCYSCSPYNVTASQEQPIISAAQIKVNFHLYFY